MHPQQRHARFNLIVIASAFVPTVLGYAVLFSRFGHKGAMPAFAFLSLFALLGFSDRFYRKTKDSPDVTMDERDEEIKRKAMLIGWGADWLFWGLICMVPWFVVAFGLGIERTQEAMIPVAWLPLVYMATGGVHMLAWSIAVLILYGKEADGDDA